MKKIIALSLVIGITHLPIGCTCNDSCGCSDDGPDGPSEITWMIEDISAPIVSYDSLGFNDLRSTDYETATVMVEITAAESIELADHSYKKPFSIISSALACSPAPPREVVSQEITRMNISAECPVYAEGKAYRPGDNFSDLFQVDVWQYDPYMESHSSKISFESVDTFIHSQNEDLSIYGRRYDLLFLRLRNPPDSTINDYLEIKIGFDNGDILAVKTDAKFIVEP